LAALAKEHLAKLPAEDPLYDVTREAHRYLEALAERTGTKLAPFGAVSLWGMVGNYTQEDVFVDTLRPFWKALLTMDPQNTPMEGEHILVFCEHEQDEPCTAHEIYLGKSGELVVTLHDDLPFSFGL